jgi:alanine dehydrogenase
MIVGVPKEIKEHEYRVGMVPEGIELLVKDGHKVFVETMAGEGVSISDKEYIEAGAEILSTKREIYLRSEMVVKVKEPLPEEFELLQKDQILFTFLHLAAAPELTKCLLKQKVIAIAYETVQLENGSLPLLIPMSVIAGRLSVQEGASFLKKTEGGRGVLLSAVPGLEPGKVVIFGGGTVGFNAAKIAIGLGAEVSIFDINMERLQYLETVFSGKIKTLVPNRHNLERVISEAHIIVGAVLVPGRKAPHVLKRDILPKMKKGAVIVDVAIDQGGCVESSKPTTYSKPVFFDEGIIHYCVSNMPGSVPRTATYALTNVTLEYIRDIANKGWRKAITESLPLKKGLNIYNGNIVCRGVADGVGLPYRDVDSIL